MTAFPDPSLGYDFTEIRLGYDFIPFHPGV